MKDSDTPKLEWWFLNPVQELKKNRSDESDGAFLVLASSIALYERYLIKLKPGTNWDNEGVRDKIGGDDLGIAPADFGAFWDCFRNGLQHQFQPKRKVGNKWVYSWDISGDYKATPGITWTDAKSCTIQVNPWEFACLVKDRFDKNPTYFEAGDSHKPGEVHEPSATQLAPAVTTTDQSSFPSTPTSPAASPTSYIETSFSTGVLKPLPTKKS